MRQPSSGLWSWVFTAQCSQAYRVALTFCFPNPKLTFNDYFKGTTLLCTSILWLLLDFDEAEGPCKVLTLCCVPPCLLTWWHQFKFGIMCFISSWNNTVFYFLCEMSHYSSMMNSLDELSSVRQSVNVTIQFGWVMICFVCLKRLSH